MNKNRNDSDESYRCLIRENARFCEVEVFFTDQPHIEMITCHGRAKAKEAAKSGAQKARRLGIPYFKDRKHIPGYIEAKEESQQKKRTGKIKQCAEDWKEWRERYESDAIAIAELINYLNRYVKRADGSYYKRDIYGIKDRWLKLNRKNIKRAEMSAQFKEIAYASYDFYDPNDNVYYYDFDDEDYQEISTEFFAYEVEIEGKFFRFHSKKQFRRKISKLNPEAHSSAKPLEDSERILPLNKAIALARWCLNGRPSALL